MTSHYPYKVDYNDHFETPLRAYEDVLPILDLISPPARSSLQNNDSKKRKRSSSPSIDRTEHTLYDPYFCAGRTKTLLASLGFANVQHEKRDFYADIRSGAVPPFDTLITNPPYSEDHKERCIEFAVQSLRKEGKSFLLLMPNYVVLKEYWRKLTQTADGKEADDIVFVVPASPYEYDHPEGTGHDIPPFASLWFCGVGKSLVEECRRAYGGQSGGTGPRIAGSINELQAIDAVKSGNRKNAKKRRKMKQLMAQTAGSADAVGTGGGKVQAPASVKDFKTTKKEKEKTMSDNGNTNQNPKLSTDNGKKKKKSKHRDASGVRTKIRF